MGGSISLIWLQTAGVDQKAPKVLLFYQKVKELKQDQIVLSFLTGWSLFQKEYFQSLRRILHQYCRISVFLLIFTVNYFTFFHLCDAF